MLVVLAAGAVAAGAGAVVCANGIVRCWPYCTFRESVMLLAFIRSSSLTPYFRAMVAGVSPKSTT